MGLSFDLKVADAENLPYDNGFFDIVYSWGVLHHSPDTPKAIAEVFRVLKPGGVAKIMIYHKYSLIGFMLWLRYALMCGKPLRTLNDVYYNYLESKGTKAYSIAEARELFKDFSTVTIDTALGHGDLLTSQAGQRHEGLILTIARMLWPRWFLKIFFKKQGLFMRITAHK